MIMKKFSLFVLLLACMTGTHAQWNFVVDVLRYGDSTEAFQMVKSKEQPGGYALGQRVAWLPNGTRVTVARQDSGVVVVNVPMRQQQKQNAEGAKRPSSATYVVTTVEGKRCLVRAADLKFGDNPAGSRNWVNPRRDPHTAVGHLYFGSGTVYWIVFGLMVLSAILMRLSVRKRHGWIYALVPVLMVAAVVLELVGVFYFWSDMFWWLDMEVHGTGWVVCYLILFLLTIYVQATSIFSYRSYLMASHDPDGRKGKLPIFRPLVYTLVAAVAFVVCFLVHAFGGADEWTMFYVGAGVAAAILFMGLIDSIRRSRRVVGLAGAVGFTLFALAWGVSLVSAIILFVACLAKVFVALMSTSLGVVAFLFLCNKLGIDITAGGAPVQSAYRDINGNVHNSQVEATSASAAIRQERLDNGQVF